MSVLLIMVPVTLILGFGFLVAFLKMASDGQYEDLVTPAHSILLEDALDQKADSQKEA